MKRLLNYLFIVLGLILLFNANSYAAEYCIKKKDDGKWPFYKTAEYKYTLTGKVKSKCPRKFKSI